MQFIMCTEMFREKKDETPPPLSQATETNIIRSNSPFSLNSLLRSTKQNIKMHKFLYDLR